MQNLHIFKIGGESFDNPARLEVFLNRFREVSGAKILVHGGGKLASELSQELGIEPLMVEGRRITDDATLRVVTMVYAGLVNKQLVAALQARDIRALGICGADLNLIRAEKRPVGDIDYGWAGDIVEIQTQAWGQLLEQNICPVLAPITHDKQGQLLNTNADTMASSLAVALAKNGNYHIRLRYCMDLPGVMEDVNNPQSLIARMNPNQYQTYRQAGVIKDGMIPKLDNAFAAIRAGVQEVGIGNEQSMAGDLFTGTLLSL